VNCSFVVVFSDAITISFIKNAERLCTDKRHNRFPFNLIANALAAYLLN